MAVNVIIADDHTVVRDGINAVIKRSGRGIRIVGEARNGRGLLASRACADVYLVDISMPDINGIEACREILKKYPHRAVIIVSMHDSPVLLEKAFEAGARGYVLKDNASEEIVPAIRALGKGEIYVSRPLRRFVARAGRRPVLPGTGLSAREREVLRLVGEGRTNKRIAHTLFISINTVLTHRKNIARKLDIHNQADLIRFALKHAIGAF